MRKLLYILLLLPVLSFAQTKIRTGQINLSLVNVLDYGAVGDSTTDNTTAIRAAIAAIPTKGGTLYFPPGQYLVSDSLLITKPTTILGFGGVGLQKNSTGGVPTTKAPTAIIMTSSTKNLFVINADKSQIQNISLWNSNTSTGSTAGHGLLINKGVGFRQENVSIYYFYINEEFVNGYLWSIDNCFFNSAVATNLIIRDNASHDDGDQSLTNSWFYAGTFTNTDHILHTSGGGLKINNCKFNSQGANVPRHCIQDLMAFNSSDLLVTNSSFENFTGYGIAVIPAPGVSYGNIIINGNEFGPFASWTGSGGINIVQIGNTTTSVPYATVINNNIFYNTVTGSISGGVYSGYNIFQGGDYTTIGAANTFNSGTAGNYDNIAIYRRSHLNFDIQKTNYIIPTASSITYFQQNGVNQLANITANTTITIDTASAYNPFILRVLQDATGGHTVTFDSNCIFTGSQTVNTATNAYTMIYGYFDRTTNKVALTILNSFGTPLATPSTVMSRDASANTAINNIITGFNTQLSNSGPFTLTNASAYQQVVTGGTNCTFSLPVASTMATGQSFFLVSQTSGTITVNTTGGNNLITMSSTTSALITCSNPAGGTGIASWSIVFYAPQNGISLAPGLNTQVLYNSSGSIGTSSNITFSPTAGPSSTGLLNIAGQLIATKGITDNNNFSIYSPAGQQAILQSYHGIQLAGGTASAYTPLTGAGTGADDYTVVIPISNVGAAGIGILGKASQTANYFEATTNANKATTHGDVFYIASDGTVNVGRSGTLIGKLVINGNTSGAISINPQAAAGTYNFNMPITAGSSGQFLTSKGGGSTAMTWSDPNTTVITGTPTIVAGTGAGTSPTVSVTTNGKQLQVTVTTGTLPTGTNATIATVTLPNALTYTPLPVFSSASAATALLNGASMIYMTSTGTANVTITSGTTALTAATTYVWNISL